MLDLHNRISINLYKDSFPYVTRKTEPLDIVKLYIIAKLRGLIKEKHRLVKKFKRFPITYGDQHRSVRDRVAKNKLLKTVLPPN